MKRFAKKGQSGAASDQLSNDLRTILDSINDGVFTVDDQFHITSFNRAAAAIIGITPEEALGRPCWQVFNADICEGACALKETMSTGSPLINKHVNIHTSAHRKVSISVSTALLRDHSGEVVGGVESFRDLTLVEELRKAAEGRATFHQMTSANHRMWEIFKLLPLLAQSDSTVLIQGESGTGKELMARAIHDLSSRARKPLVTLNCGALPCFYLFFFNFWLNWLKRIAVRLGWQYYNRCLLVRLFYFWFGNIFILFRFFYYQYRILNNHIVTVIYFQFYCFPAGNGIGIRRAAVCGIYTVCLTETPFPFCGSRRHI